MSSHGLPRALVPVLLMQGEASELQPLLESGQMDRMFQFGEMGEMDIFFGDHVLDQDQSEIVSKLSQMASNIQSQGGKPWPGAFSVLDRVDWGNRNAAFKFVQNPSWFLFLLRALPFIIFTIFVGSVLIFGLMPTLGVSWRIFKHVLEAIAQFLGLSVPELLAVVAAVGIGGFIISRSLRR